MTSVMGSGGWTGYIAESLDAQNSRFDFSGGGATSAMNDSTGFSCQACMMREYPKDFGTRWGRIRWPEDGQVLTAGLWEADLG